MVSAFQEFLINICQAGFAKGLLNGCQAGKSPDAKDGWILQGHTEIMEGKL